MYYAAEHAVEGLSGPLKLELKQFCIHVVVLAPGFIAPEFGPFPLNGFARIRKDSAYRNVMDKKIITGNCKGFDDDYSSNP